MDLVCWKLEFKPGWDMHFSKFDGEAKKRILKKFEQMKQPLFARGLLSCRIKVEEVGQYRIAFEENELLKIKQIHFVGNHKQYERWFREEL